MRRNNLQSPCEITVEIFVNTLHVLERDLLTKHHLVERTNEERIEEAAVENGKSDDPSNEFEVVEVLGVHTRMGINLQGVIIVCGVFEKAIKWIKHFVGEKKEEFTRLMLVNTTIHRTREDMTREDIPRKTTVVETVFTIKLDHQALLQV
jgi:hypothetical protein